MFGVCFFAGEYRATSVQRPTFRDWSDLGKAFGADVIMWVTDPSQEELNPAYPFLDVQYPNLIQHADLSSAMDSTPGVPWVFVENDPQAISLVDFTHPTDVVYCFGSDAKGLDGVDRSLGDWVSIPTVSALWANQTAAVVLSNRQF